MLTLFKHLDRQALAHEAPTFLFSLLFAEYAFKFHSFTLECLAFLALWGTMSALTSGALKVFQRQ